MPAYCVALLFSFLTFAVHGQSVSTLIGARAAGAGNASATFQDQWAMLNNVAGIAQVREVTVGSAADVHPFLPGANRIATSVLAPLPTGVVGLTLFRFGDAFYHEQIAAAGYANTLGIASLGIKVSFIQYQPEGVRSKNAVSFSFGGIATLTPVVKGGAYITNLNQPTLSRLIDEKLPTLMTVGLGITPVGKFLFLLELEKDIDFNLVVKAGMVYTHSRKISFRTGFNLHPDLVTTGISWHQQKFRFAAATQYNPRLGISQMVEIVIPFKRKKSQR